MCMGKGKKELKKKKNMGVAFRIPHVPAFREALLLLFLSSAFRLGRRCRNTILQLRKNMYIPLEGLHPRQTQDNTSEKRNSSCLPLDS